MPILQVRDMPDAIYQKLIEQARKEHRSISQQALVELAKAMDMSLHNKDRRNRVIEAIHQLHQNFSFKARKSPVNWVREDRSR
jgi:hypothetical protein